MSSFESIHLKSSSESPDLVVAFSARAVPKGRFTFWKALHQLPVSALFVNDYSAGWYLRGTPEFADDEGLLGHLAEQAQEARRRGGRVLLLGASMGAYAALKYGAALNADRILAMGPESELCIPHGRSITSLKGMKEGDGDISGLRYRSPADVMVVSGNADIVDFYAACKLKSATPALNVRLIDNHNHVVARYLDAKFGIASVIDQWLLQCRSDFLEQCELGNLVDLPLALAVKRFSERLAKGETDLAESSGIKRVAAACPTWAFGHYFVACVLEAEGEISAAMDALRRSLKANPGLGRARFRLASLLSDAGQVDEAISELETLSAQAHTLSIGNMLAKLHAASGQHGGAIAALERSTRLKLERTQAAAVWHQISGHAEALLHAARQFSGKEPALAK